MQTLCGLSDFFINVIILINNNFFLTDWLVFANAYCACAGSSLGFATDVNGCTYLFILCFVYLFIFFLLTSFPLAFYTFNIYLKAPRRLISYVIFRWKKKESLNLTSNFLSSRLLLKITPLTSSYILSRFCGFFVNSLLRIPER